MKPSYLVLRDIAESNPLISHFMVRLYRQTPDIFNYDKSNFSYLFVSVDQIDSLETIINDYENQDYMVALMSTVMTTKGIRSLLMLDFSLPKSKQAEQEIIQKIRDFNNSGDINYKLDGWLIETNNSYHYIGKYITVSENFRNFLGSSLLFRHKEQSLFVVDDRWLGHQLKHDFGSIRIGKKEGNYPLIVCEI